MRVVWTDPDNVSFISWFSDLSYDPKLHVTIELPPYINRTILLGELYDFIYPREIMACAIDNFDVFLSRAILTSRNSTVSEINDILLNQLTGQLQEYCSVDTADVPDSEEYTRPPYRAFTVY